MKRHRLSQGPTMGKKPVRYGVIASALFVSAQAADAHGIAGSRLFVGTLVRLRPVAMIEPWGVATALRISRSAGREATN